MHLAGNLQQCLQAGHLLLQVNHFGLALEKEEVDIAGWHQSSTAFGAWDQDLLYPPGLQVATPEMFEDDILEEA